MPIPRPDSGSLNIIAASGADPVTMQKRIWGSPSAFRASSVEPVSRPAPSGLVAAPVASMQPPFSDVARLQPHRANETDDEGYDLGGAGARSRYAENFCLALHGCRVGGWSAMARLPGLRALVTGGTSGIGAAIVARLR